MNVSGSGAEKVENPYSCTVKLQSACSGSHKVCMHHAIFGYGGSNDVTAVFVV